MALSERIMHVRHKHPPSMHPVHQAPAEQSNLAWSYATLEAEPRPELMSILASALVQRISDCNPQELSNTIWAFAKLRAPCPSSSCVTGILGEPELFTWGVGM